MEWYITIAAIWYVTGYILAIHEMRFGNDIGLGCMFGAMFIALVGPLVAIATMSRRGLVFLRKYDDE